MAEKKVIKAYACYGIKKDLVEFGYEPLPLGPHDVHMRIVACGCCHSGKLKKQKTKQQTIHKKNNKQ